MKKLMLLFVCVFVFSSFIKAQGDCLALFPTNKGTVLVNKSYDAANNLLSVITYTVSDTYTNADNVNMLINFAMTNAQKEVIDQGTLDAYCNNGNFYLKMINRCISPEVLQMLSRDTELVGDFLDYPNTFASPTADSPFEMNGGEFVIKSRSDKKDLLRVKVYDRNYEKNEEITTPAGVFDASKVTFNFDVTNGKTTTTYKGVEWYAENAGIVRSDTYDKNGSLQSFTELTTLKGE